jgi:predicted Zn-dependent protease
MSQAILNGNPLSVTFNSADNWTFALVGISVKQQIRSPESVFGALRREKAPGCQRGDA